MKCDECGAYMEVDGSRTEMFCSYCGHKVFIDDEVIKKIEEEHIIIEDKAQIRAAEASEKIKLSSIEADTQSLTMRNQLIILGCIWAVIFIIGIIIIALFK